MKKLMTMLSAATVAIGLYAEETYTDTGTSFEGATADVFDWENAVDDLGDNATGYWGTTNTDANAWKVVAGPSIARNADSIDEEPPYPKQFVGTAQDKHLHIASSFGNPLTRYVNKNHDGMTLEGDFYFDSLVKFTAFDAGDLPEQVTNELENAKIAVWIQTSDDESTTNLWVRAGQFDSNGVVHPHDYNCGEFSKADAWHRLTIKAIKNISTDVDFKPGFAVFIDNQIPNSIGEDSIGLNNIAGECSGFYTAGNLFPSMVQGMQDAGDITSVSFDGQGDIDDVVFTANQPFKAAAAAQMATITWNSATSHITSFTIGETVYSNGIAQINFTPDGETGVMLVTLEDITYADGWTGPAEIRVDIDSSTKTAALSAGIAGEIVAYFNVAAYTNLTGAVNAADESEKPGTLKLYKTPADEDDKNIVFSTAESVTIDLNGQTIGGIEASETAVAITNSSDVVGVVSEYVILGDGSSIAGGKFEDTVEFAEGATATITGGAFASGSNDAEILNTFAPKGYKFVEGTDEYKGYLVLAEKGEEIEVPTAATGLVYNGNEQTGVVAGTDYTLTGTAAATDAGEYTATATPKAGYAWVGGSTEATNIVWSIAKAQVTATVSLTVTEATYDSEKNAVTDYTTPSVNFGLGAPTLVENTDYTVAWSATEVTGAGTFTYTVSPVETSNYTFTEASATLTITAGGGGLDPEAGTVEVVINDAQDGDDAIAKAKAAIVAPTGATVDKADYADYFTYSAAGDAGTYTVTITGVKDEIKANVLGSAVERLTDAEATTVEVPAGLYYSITPSTSLPISGTATKGLSTGGTVDVDKPGSTAGFYEIKLSATPIND